MAIKKIQKKTLRQTVYEQLRESIITAELVPGQTVSLRGLAERMGVSPMPVREALFQLESEKIVVINENKFIRINELSRKDVQEIFRIRISLETMICDIACEKRPDSALPGLRQIMDEMWKIPDDRQKYAEMHHKFHFSIYELADSPILLELIDSLWARIGPYFLQIADIKGIQSFSNPHHEKFFNALADKDNELMKDMIKTGLERTCNKILSSLFDIDGLKQNSEVSSKFAAGH